MLNYNAVVFVYASSGEPRRKRGGRIAGARGVEDATGTQATRIN